MCCFITAIVPGAIKIESLQPICSRHGMLFSALENKSLIATIKDDHYVRATRAFCDCDSALGSAMRSSKPKTGDALNIEIARLKKKGWSAHKIERWLMEKDKNYERSADNLLRKNATDLAEWRHFFDEYFLTGTAYIGVLLHFYCEALDTESLNLKATERLIWSSVRDDELLSLQEDVLYLFSK